MLLNCLNSSNKGECEQDENRPYCNSPMVESTNTSEVATVVARGPTSTGLSIIDHAEAVLQRYRNFGEQYNQNKERPAAKSGKKRHTTVPTSSPHAISEDDRFDLLLNLLRVDSEKGASPHRILQLSVQLGGTIHLSPERMQLLVESLVRLGQQKVPTSCGQSILVRNYLLLKLLEAGVKVQLLSQSPEQVYSQLHETKATIRLLVSEMLQNLQSQLVKNFLSKLVADSYAVMSSKEFALAGMLVMVVQNQLVEMVSVGGLDTDRAGCLSLMGMMMGRTIHYMNHLPNVLYEKLEGQQDAECDVCKCSSALAMKFIIERTSSHEFVVCENCCFVSPKNKNIGKLLVNLLPLVLGNYSSNFQTEDIRRSKVLLVAHLADELIASKSKFLEVVEYLERAPVKVLTQDISEQCLAYFNTFSQKVGLVFQFRQLFGCWTGELSCDNHLRRTKALKELPQLLQLYKPRSHDHDLDDYKRMIESMLAQRVVDVNENVRLEALKTVVKLYAKSKESLLLAIAVDRLSDSDHRIRSFAMTFVQDQSITIFQQPICFCNTVTKLVDLTFDTYGTIRKRASKCLQLLLMPKKKNLAELVENISSLLDHDAVKSDKTYLKAIVDALLQGESRDNLVHRLFEALLRTNIHQGKIMFAQLLADRYRDVLLAHLESFLEVEKDGLTIYSEHLYSSILLIINDLIDINCKYTAKQRTLLENLLTSVEDYVFTQTEELAKAALPLLVKLSILFGKEAKLLDTINKCLSFLESCKGGPGSQPSSVQDLYRCMLIVAVGSISLHRLGRDHRAVSCYESILWWVDNCPNIEVRRQALQAICLYWEYDQKFLYYSEEAITRVLPFIEDQRSILLVYRCFQSTLRELIELKSNAPIIGVVECLFIKSCRRFINCPDPLTRLTMVKLIDHFIKIGNSNPMEFVKYILAYMCDSQQEVRAVAVNIAGRLAPRFLLNNFKESMSMVAEVVLQNYGEIDVSVEDRCFFSQLIEQPSKQPSSRKSTLPSKQMANRISFMKKVGELLTNSECLFSPSDLRLLELCSAIIDASREFERFDYIEIIRSLNTKIEQNYYKLTKTLKRIVREGCDDSEDQPSIKEGYVMYRLLYSLSRLTGGKSAKTRINEIEASSGAYFAAVGCSIPKMDSNNDIQELYSSIQDLHDLHSQKPRKMAALRTNTKTAGKDRSKSKQRSYMKSAPKISLEDRYADESHTRDTHDEQNEQMRTQFRQKLRRRNKPTV